jgi:hypothetical protein
MKQGGFHAVIGNPPWLMAGYYYAEHSTDYVRGKYKTAERKFDLYYLFIEKGLELLRTGGMFGMIVPNKLFHTKAASTLRNHLGANRWVRKVVDFRDKQIFRRATNYSCILVLASSWLTRKDSPEGGSARCRSHDEMKMRYAIRPLALFSTVACFSTVQCR